MIKKRKRGLSQIIAVTLILILAIISVTLIGRVVFSFIEKGVDNAAIKADFLKETFQMKKVVINASNLSEVKITFCCAAETTREKEIEEVIETTGPLDVGIVIDRSGSMRQSGWTLDLEESLSPTNEYLNVNVPRDDYSSSNIFNVAPGTERIAILLNWDRREGYNGSEGSEFALNLRNPTGTWIFGSNRPAVGGMVDPPDNIAGPNEYFSGISTKPQIVYIENPASGNWRVKVYGWNLRPSTNRPPSQDVNISVYSGTSSQIIKNPTIISIDAAKDSSKNFVNNIREDDAASYTVFGSYGVLRQSLTSNKNLLITAIDNTGMEGGTAVQTGIEISKNDFIANARPEASKIMLLLTDGQNDIGPNVVIQEAQDAKDEGIEIFTVGLTGFVDSDMLTAAASGPDHYYYAPDASVLQTIFDSIRDRIIEEHTTTLLSDKFVVVFYNETYSYSVEIKNYELQPLATKTFSFNLDGKITNITRVELYPAILNKNGKYVLGDAIDYYKP